MTTASTAPQLLRHVGLLADGPVLWGRAVAARTPGVYAIELPAPLPSAPIDPLRVAKWLERVPELRLDGGRPTARDLAARIAAYWLPEQIVVFVGSTKGPLGPRVAALQATPLGDPRPYAGGYWLQTLRGLESARVWWATTDAPQEYEDALLDAFADGVGAAERSRIRDGDPVLPFGVLRRPTGERRRHGITGAVLPEAADAPSPSRASGTRRSSPAGVGGSSTRRLEAPTRVRPKGTTTSSAAQATFRAPLEPKKNAAVPVSAEGLERLRDELRQLRDVQRPAAVKRLVAARELGDLKENGDYIATREELGFIDGRIQMLDAQVQNSRVFETPRTGRAGLGSTLVVRIDGTDHEYHLVGSAEADPDTGRISTSSPVGRALVGRGVGDHVTITTPGGQQRVEVVDVR